MTERDEKVLHVPLARLLLHEASELHLELGNLSLDDLGVVLKTVLCDPTLHAISL